MENIETFYPLSPMQEGMLFHSLTAGGSAAYLRQLSGEVSGVIDAGVFERAWQQVINRHAVLRTSFVWDELPRPVQVVQRHGDAPLDHLDWRNLSRAEQAERLQQLLEHDRERGFELTRAPLMRLALIRLSEERSHLLWSFHHILLDGWSVHLVLQEVIAFYQAYSRNQEPRLERPYQFRDYIVWLNRQELSGAAKYWRETLKGFTVQTPLPGDRRTERGDGGAPSSGDYQAQRSHLSGAATSALQALAHQHKLTLNTIVQGAWAVLLSRLSSRDDVVFGAVVSGRPAELPGAENIVGIFINTLPVRARVNKLQPLLPWLKELQTAQLEARRYEYSPLVQIKGWSEIAGELPLFESNLAFENFHISPTMGGGSAETKESQERRGLDILNVESFSHSTMPLTVAIKPGPELLVQMSYDPARFEADSIARLLSSYQCLLEGLAEMPARRICDLPLLRTEERKQLLVEWNRTHVRNQVTESFPQLFEARVAQAPQQPAVVSDDEHVTYAELNERANRLAHYLRDCGVGPEVRVGLLLERSVNLMVGLIGILKAGGAYVPLDTSYPQERISLILRDAGAQMLLTQQHLSNRLALTEVETLCLDSDWEAISAGVPVARFKGAAKLRSHLNFRLNSRNRKNPPRNFAPENLAYVIYTSGSTGRPKGVGIEHRSLTNLWMALRWAIYQLQGERLHIGLNAPLAFDASVKQLLQLLGGHTLYLIPEEMRYDGQSLISYIERHQLEVLDCTPSHLELLFAAGLQERLRQSRTTLLVGGEAINQPLWDFLSTETAALHYNVYGPTECTVDATCCAIRRQESKATIGRPIANTQVYILDEELQPVPVGVTGELHLGGAGLARGYLNRPEATAEKFIPHPFSETPGARLYKTGDAARYLPDGAIEFTGRIDRQVKIRGYRIELEEIEVILSQHRAVREAVLIVNETASSDKSLTAYFVPTLQGAPGSEELREFLSQRLAEQMIPARFVPLEALPLTSRGKVDRQALAELEEEGKQPAAPWGRATCLSFSWHRFGKTY